MKFESRHIIFGDILEPEVFTPDALPAWMAFKSLTWWVEGYVFKLQVGSSIESDFHHITRIE